MGNNLTSCGFTAEPEAGELDVGLPTCLKPAHVEALLQTLSPDMQSKLYSKAFEEECAAAFAVANKNRSGMLDAGEMTDAVQKCLGTVFLDRMHISRSADFATAFHESKEAKLSIGEFTKFCRWATAMKARGFLDGQHPFEIVNEGKGNRLIIVSEFLDDKGSLRSCVKPGVDVATYDPDGITLDEFAMQLQRAQQHRTRMGLPGYSSVALANHGPDKSMDWFICAGAPVSLAADDVAWSALMPAFTALASLCDKDGRLDVLACNFASTPGGMGAVKHIEQQCNIKVCASMDETGNVEKGGNWEMEVGGVNVAPFYFNENELFHFEKLMSVDTVKKSTKKDGSKKNATKSKKKPVHEELNKVLKKHSLDDPSKWCVTLGQIRELQQMIPDGYSEYAEKYADTAAKRAVADGESPAAVEAKKAKAKKAPWSMSCVVTKWVKPMTLDYDKSGKTSYSKMKNPNGLKVSLFISHAWREPFKEFYRAIQQYYDTHWNEKHKCMKNPNKGYWICALGLPQNDPVVLKELLGENIPLTDIPFARAMRVAPRVLCVRNSVVDLHTRPWCLFEMKMAIDFSNDNKACGGNRFPIVRACGPKMKLENGELVKLEKGESIDHKKASEIMEKNLKECEEKVGNPTRLDYSRIQKAMQKGKGTTIFKHITDEINKLAINGMDLDLDEPDELEVDEDSDDDM